MSNDEKRFRPDDGMTLSAATVLAVKTDPLGNKVFEKVQAQVERCGDLAIQYVPVPDVYCGYFKVIHLNSGKHVGITYSLARARHIAQELGSYDWSFSDVTAENTAYIEELAVRARALFSRSDLEWAAILLKSKPEAERYV